ncbi:MAG: NAD(P)H-dependent oxidoreductase [Eggerthellaceae bacterium]|nr:NAD(P)H-dependent oxidoreductase [Eggerthellaceae bacterium]
MKKALVAYFSAEGTTARLAKKLAEAIGADLFEIAPETPYTRADLDWRDKTSRSTLEMQDRSCRPTIAGCVEDMAAYDVVFVGFPIWWYREPSIIDTFMEAYDFAGKSVVPFATSGGSGMADSGANMAALAPGAKVDEGRRFSSLARSAELAAWAGTWLN